MLSSAIPQESKIQWNWRLIAPLFVMLFGMWFNSGTLTPYAATLSSPEITSDCNYIVNIDDVHFRAAFLMLDGAPRDEWKDSVVLRRVLYPMLAFVFVKTFGYLTGGFICNLVLTGLTMTAWSFFLLKRFGERGGLTGMWLTATYPGIMYYAGLPYCYALIAPCCLLATMLLYELHHSFSFLRLVLVCAALGVFQTGYDLLHFYGLCLMFIIAFSKDFSLWKKFLFSISAFVLMLFPSAVVMFFLEYKYNLQSINANSKIYAQIFDPNSYLGYTLLEWREQVFNAIKTLSVVFWTSTFFALPIGYVVVVLLERIAVRKKNFTFDIYFLRSFIILALLINIPMLNAKENHWVYMFQGDSMARTYQPIFAMFILALADLTSRMNGRPRKAAQFVVALVVCTQALVSFGPFLHLPKPAKSIYYYFYKHSSSNAFAANLTKYGRRPLGFCRNQNQQ